MGKGLIEFTYTAEKDGILYPNISVGNGAQNLSRFGREWMDNLHRNHKQRFMTLRMQGKLEKTAHRVEQEALERQENLFQGLLQKHPLPDTQDTLERARHLNKLRHIAEEFVMKEIVLTPR